MNNYYLAIALSIAFLQTQSAQAIPAYSKSAGESFRSLPEVKKGGTLYLRNLGNPKVLIPTLSEDVETTNVLHNIFVPLMMTDPETNEAFPVLAEKLDISKDHKVLTYTLRKDAVWEDGTPITTEDVEFSFQTMMNPKVEAAFLRPYFDGHHFEKIDSRTFRFTVDKPNVNTVDMTNSDFLIIQKKQFANDSDFNRAKGVMQPVGNGPYRLKSFSRDQKIELERKKDWWGFKIPELKNVFNFDTLVFRIVPDTTLAYEKFMKGEVDVIEMNAEMFGTRVHGSDKDKFGSDEKTDKAVWAKHMMTKAPAQWTYMGWNLKRPVFQSKKTRQALAMLINYSEIIDKVYHGEAVPCFSPFGSFTPNTAPDQKKHAFKFEPTRAIALLKEDGWSDVDHDGVLAKMIDGKKTKFAFTVRFNSENPMRAKIAQIAKEQFKKAGINMSIQALEFNTLITAMDERDFDAIIMGWGKGSLNQDSKQIWHSKSYENKGSNAIGYSNPDADKLIDEASSEVDVQKHFKINQKIGAIIYDDQPYAFIVEIPGYMAGFQTRKLKAKKWAMKYDDEPAHWIYSQRE